MILIVDLTLQYDVTSEILPSVSKGPQHESKRGKNVVVGEVLLCTGER